MAARTSPTPSMVSTPRRRSPKATNAVAPAPGRAPAEALAVSRARRTKLDHNNVMDAVLGVSRALSWGRLRGLGLPLARARDEVREDHRAGAPPPLT